MYEESLEYAYLTNKSDKTLNLYLKYTISLIVKVLLVMNLLLYVK